MVMAQLALSVNNWLRVVVFLLALAFLGAPSWALSPVDAPSGSYIYQVSRDGQVIGLLRQDFARQNERLVVVTAADIEVTLLGFSLYEADQRVEETWRNGVLQSVVSNANVDGEDRQVTLRREGNRLVGVYNGKERDLSAKLIPTTLWNSAIVEARAVLDTAKGKIRKVTVTDLGPERISLPEGEIMARRYAIAGEFRRQLWYDEAGVLVAVEMQAKDGSIIRQELLQRP